MKYLFSLIAVLTVMACNSKPERPAPILDPNYEPTEVNSKSDLAEPAQNMAGVWHYTCENGCEGGAGSAVPCATCGSTLKHNQQYHSKTNSSAATNSLSSTTIPAGSQGVNLNPGAVPKPKEPAQNASGVWHYTCSNGCSGGAGSAMACNTCGTTLVHNQAYHQ